MALILLVLILAILFGGLGFLLHALWWVAAIVLIVWLVGFAFRAGEGRRWYRWYPGRTPRPHKPPPARRSLVTQAPAGLRCPGPRRCHRGSCHTQSSRTRAGNPARQPMSAPAVGQLTRLTRPSEESLGVVPTTYGRKDTQ